MGTMFNALGNLSGKVGDVIFRQRNGKTIIYKAPKRRNKTVSPKVIKGRGKFTAVSQITTSIYSIPQFKQIWRYCCKRYQNPHNLLFKNIYKYMDSDDFTKFGGIIPNHSSNIIKCSFVQSTPKIIVKLIEPAFEGDVFSEYEFSLMIAGIVVLSEPRNAGDLPMRVIGIKSGIYVKGMELPSEIEIWIGGDNLSKIMNYNKREYYLHLITLDSDGSVCRYSDKIKQCTKIK